jgi:hypothetical protein
MNENIKPVKITLIKLCLFNNIGSKNPKGTNQNILPRNSLKNRPAP